MPISKRPLDATDDNPPQPKKPKAENVKRKLKFLEKIGYKSDRWHSLLMYIPPSSEEFKRLLVKEIGSLLNDKGGKLCFGCRSNGMIHGERITRKEEDNLKLIIDDSLKKFHPFVSPSSYRVEFLPVSHCDTGERFVIEISICPGAQDLYEDEFHEVYLRRNNQPFGPLSPHEIKDHVTAKYRKKMAALLKEASRTEKAPVKPSSDSLAARGKAEDNTSSAVGSGSQKKNSEPVSSDVGAKATDSSKLLVPSKGSGPVSSSSGDKSSHAASVSAENKPPSSTASVQVPCSSQATTSAKVASTSSATTSASFSTVRLASTTTSKPIKLTRPRSNSVVQPLSHSLKANQLPPLIPRQQSIYGHPPLHNQAPLRACNEYPPCCNYQPLPSRLPPSENFPVFANLANPPRTPIPFQRLNPIPFQRPDPVPFQKLGPIPCQRPGPIPCQRPGLIAPHILSLIPHQIPPRQIPSLIPYQRPSFPAQYP